MSTAEQVPLAEAETQAAVIETPALESVTKEAEDLLYPSKDKEELKAEETPEKTAEPSEEPAKDKVAEGEDDKSQDDSEKPEDSKEEIEYELKLSEESHLLKETVAEVEAFAKENNLSKEAAANMLKREESAISNFLEREAEAMERQTQEWEEAVVADKDLGGENFEQTKLLSRKVTDRFGSEELTEILNNTGYGNHPAVVRLLTKIGSMMDSDSLISGKEPEANKELHEYFYKPTS